MKREGKLGPITIMLPLAIFMALLIASCASTGDKQKKAEDTLKDSVNSFNESFRAEDFSNAAVWVSKDKRGEFWNQVDRFKGKVRLSEYELREANLHGSCEGVAILHFQYWRPDAPILKNINITQKWYFSQKEQLWRVADDGFGKLFENN